MTPRNSPHFALWTVTSRRDPILQAVTTCSLRRLAIVLSPSFLRHLEPSWVTEWMP